MKIARTFQTFFKSFYSAALYREVRTAWLGYGFRYLFLLVAISAAAYAIRANSELSKPVEIFLRDYAGQVPEVVIKKGKAEIKAEQPHHITIPTTGEVIGIFDQSLGEAELKASNAAFLLNGDAVFVRGSGFTPGAAGNSNEIITLGFDGIDDAVVNSSVVRMWAKSVRRWAPVVMFIIVLAFEGIVKLLQMVFFGWLIVLLAKAQNLELIANELVTETPENLEQKGLQDDNPQHDSSQEVELQQQNLQPNRVLQPASRLAVVAMTPSALLDSAVTVLGISIPWWSLIFYLLIICYVFFALKAQKVPISA